MLLLHSITSQSRNEYTMKTSATKSQVIRIMKIYNPMISLDYLKTFK